MSPPRTEPPTTADEWLARAKPLVRHVVRRYVSDASGRDDLAQDCLIWILQRCHEYDPADRDWDEWVFRACDSCCRQARAKEVRRARLSRRVVLDRSPNSDFLRDECWNEDPAFSTDERDAPLSQLMQSEQRVKILEVVRSMDPGSRELITRLYGLDGRPPAETIEGTASYFGLPALSCARQIRAALTVLRKSLSLEVLE